MDPHQAAPPVKRSRQSLQLPAKTRRSLNSGRGDRAQNTVQYKNLRGDISSMSVISDNFGASSGDEMELPVAQSGFKSFAAGKSMMSSKHKSMKQNKSRMVAMKQTNSAAAHQQSQYQRSMALRSQAYMICFSFFFFLSLFSSVVTTFSFFHLWLVGQSFLFTDILFIKKVVE